MGMGTPTAARTEPLELIGVSASIQAG